MHPIGCLPRLDGEEARIDDIKVNTTILIGYLIRGREAERESDRKKNCYSLQLCDGASESNFCVKVETAKRREAFV